LLVIQAPRITAILQLRDDMIRDLVPLAFGQSFLQTADDLSRSPEGVCDCVLKGFD
jgi:hypothetical protein